MGALVSDQQDGMEAMEAMWPGRKGDKGDKGEKGQRGLPQGQARAIVYMFLLCIALFIVLGAGLFHYIHANQAAQQSAGFQVERKLCADVATMSAIQPPAGATAANPSRAYEQAEHRAWAGLVIALGCKETP